MFQFLKTKAKTKTCQREFGIKFAHKLGTLSLVPVGTTFQFQWLLIDIWRYNVMMLLCLLEEESKKKKLVESIGFTPLPLTTSTSWENEEFFVGNVNKVWNQERKWILIVYVTSITSLKTCGSSLLSVSWKINSNATLPYLYQHTTPERDQEKVSQ